MLTKNMDVRMTDETIRQQQEIKEADGISITKARQKIVAEGVAKMHKKLFKADEPIKTMGTPENE